MNLKVLRQPVDPGAHKVVRRSIGARFEEEAC